MRSLSNLASTLVIKMGSFFGTKPLINCEAALYKHEGDHSRRNQTEETGKLLRSTNLLGAGTRPR